MKRIFFTLAIALLGILTSAGIALAQSSSESGYGGQAGAVQAEVDGGGALPFTGLDVGLLIGGGLLLVGVGASLRRLSRSTA
jgi:hypothetical protein